jgi:hypothetical protein
VLDAKNNTFFKKIREYTNKLEQKYGKRGYTQFKKLNGFI